MWLYFTQIIFSLLFVKATDFESLRLLDDSILYKILYKSADDEILLTNKDSKNWVSMMSADEEEYRCLLPTVETTASINFSKLNI